ncbi:pectate lyase [Mangrovibacterium lignilyticum]|uniref:pectate lyase n=1 Tax=Mangrovibacterium lignilyticum TaxID=2668052 RepID=UPI0013D08BF0|nr:pectate lyase [Mangrovibacterium lignilyticum]
MKRITLLIFCLTYLISSSSAQDYLAKSWKQVATQMPDEWYGTAEAAEVAGNVLLAQKDIGGWAKNKPYHHHFTEGDKAEYFEAKGETGATIDNGATTMEMRFLAKIYAAQPDARYKDAFEKGLAYLYEAQYDNGGWPQFYPVREGKSVHYSADITYNDNAMINVMRLLEDVFKDHDGMDVLKLGDDLKKQAKAAYDRGVDCILNTQIVVNGQPTVWCAQHDPVTLAPDNARKYELASFSGAESVNIVDLLMDLEHPSPEIIAAVEGAIKWFNEHKLEGIRLERVTNAEGEKDLVVVEDPEAETLWARFYDLETGNPYFCDRDGIKKNTLAEIGYERRNGYGWYTNAPEKILKAYPKWQNDWVTKR